MKPKKRQKLCQNCEGEVDLDVIFCPFCGADLLEEKELSLNDKKENYYSPPYSPVKQEIEEEPPVEKETKEASFFWPFVAFNLGVWLFLLGVFLLLFSKEGVLWLKLDATRWLYFLLLSFPLLAWGSRVFLEKKEKDIPD